MLINKINFYKDNKNNLICSKLFPSLHTANILHLLQKIQSAKLIRKIVFYFVT